MGKLHPDVNNKLKSPLDLHRIKTRKQGTAIVSFLEGHDIITIANEIFGFDGWGYEPIGEIKTEKIGSGYLSKARVKVFVKLDDGTFINRTDVGYCVPAVGAGKDPRPDAIDTSEKGAVTDALKRAFRSFGNQFGNSLYNSDNPTGLITKSCPSCQSTMYWKIAYSKEKDKNYEGFFCEKRKELKCPPIDFKYIDDDANEGE